MSEKDQRESAIKNAVSQIEKQFGKGAIMKLGSKDALAKTKNLQKRIIEELIPLWGWTLKSFTDSLYESKKK